MLENEQWFLKNRKGNIAKISKELNISPLIAKLLVSRSVNTVEQARTFLNPDVDKMYDPMLLKDMDRAIDIILEAAKNDKKVLIIGDYDVDGIMGIYILNAVFTRIFSKVTYCIPHRMEDGYGINDKIIEKAWEDGVDLIVTCDNGISAYEQMIYANQKGMKVVITDHHDIPYESMEDGVKKYKIPPADAVVDPRRSDCQYPYKGLCGAVVAFKLAMALMNELGITIEKNDWDELFCFAAIATICDIVELLDENRIIVSNGLKLLNRGIQNPGLMELIDICGLTGKEMTTYEIGHVLGPCINATGRLGAADISLELLMENDRNTAKKMAQDIQELNKKRQCITKEAFESAENLVLEENLAQKCIMVLYLPEIHESICGIVAGKIKDKYNRPAIVLTDSQQGYVKGSGRSVDNYNLLDGINQVKNFLIKLGGHEMAVGVSLEKDMIAQFSESLNQHCCLTEQDLQPKQLIDMSLNGKDINFELLQELKCLEPYGRGNLKPVFAIKNIILRHAALVGNKKNVIKIKFALSEKKSFDAVFFGDIEVFLKVLKLTLDDRCILRSKTRNKLVDVIFHLEINEYNGVKKMQLVVKSIRNA